MNQFYGFSRAQCIALIVISAALAIGGLGVYIFDTTAPLGNEAVVQAAAGSFEPIIRLDLNTAPADSLELIPYIGPVLAARIVAYRKTHGRFDSVDSLCCIPGIGQLTLKRIRPYLKVAGE